MLPFGRCCDGFCLSSYQCCIGIGAGYGEVIPAANNLAVEEHEVVGLSCLENNILIGRGGREDTAGYCAGDFAFEGVGGGIVGQHGVSVVGNGTCSGGLGVFGGVALERAQGEEAVAKLYGFLLELHGLFGFAACAGNICFSFVVVVGKVYFELNGFGEVYFFSVGAVVVVAASHKGE